MKPQLPDHPARRRAVVGVGFLAVAALMSMSIFATGPDASPETPTEKAWPVSVVVVEPGQLNPAFAAFGRVESTAIASIRTDLVARVAEVPVNEGDHVQAGDLLLRLDDAEVRLQLQERQADLLQAEATLRSIATDFDLSRGSTSHFESMQRIAQDKLARHQDLMAQRLISQSLLDEVIGQANKVHIDYQNHVRRMADFPNRIDAQRAVVARAEALKARSELDLAKTEIRAPFDGPVLAVMVAAGDRTNLVAPLLEVADENSFEVRVQIPDAYATRMRDYLAAGIEITAHSSETMMQLTRVSGRVREGQSGLDAFFTLPLASVRQLPSLGRVLDVSITLPAEADVIALPAHALYQRDRIYQVRDSRLQAITVNRIGEYQNEQGQHRVLVRSAQLAAGDSVMTTQLPRAITGLLVQPVNT